MKRATVILAAALVVFCTMSADAQVVINDLRAERNDYGDVVLMWTPPQGVIISQYKIWRKQGLSSFIQLAELHSSAVRQFTDPYPGLIPNATYFYFLEAVDITGSVGGATVEVKVTPPPSSLQFEAAPPTTATVGLMYFYSPRIANTADQRDIEYSFVTYPDGLDLNYFADGTARIAWTPVKAGYYNVTLVARNKRTGARGVQEFAIRVATRPGTVLGYVFSGGDLNPIKGALVRVNQVLDGMMYEVETASDGSFVLPNVQSGEVYAYCALPGNSFAPQWYPLGRSLVDVTPRTLRPDDTLTYAFYLMPLQNARVRVTGTIRSLSGGGPIAGATVSFVQKNRYIQISDSALISDPGYFSSFVFDTTITSAADGSYEAMLPVGRAYYSVVSSASHRSVYAPDQSTAAQTNPLESRAFVTRDGMSAMNYTLVPTSGVPENRLVGTVSSSISQVSKQSVVVLIDTELKRGAGGGHTYRRYISVISDSLGRYAFDNLPASSSYSLLAIPLDRGLAPQYFSAGGGTTTFQSSDDISVIGTVQNIDFHLQPTKANGVGTIYGRIMIRQNQTLLPGAGSLVFAASTTTSDIYGYAVADSTGWYFIPGLPAGGYTLTAENMVHGSAQGATSLTYQHSYNLFDATRQLDLTIQSIVSSLPEIPSSNSFVLYQNYPNPFNPTTSISFSVPSDAPVTLRVTDAMGRLVATLHEGRLPAGLHSVTFDARTLPSGTYFYQLISGATTVTRSMILLK